VVRAADERRARGSIRRRGKSLQVLVYAGVDPLTGQRMYLSEPTSNSAPWRAALGGTAAVELPRCASTPRGSANPTAVQPRSAAARAGQRFADCRARPGRFGRLGSTDGGTTRWPAVLALLLPRSLVLAALLVAVAGIKGGRRPSRSDALGPGRRRRGVNTHRPREREKLMTFML